MRRLLQRSASVFRLTRVTGAFAAVANVWFVIVWTRAVPAEPGTAELTNQPLWASLAGGALTALGLYAFGATLNDVVDAKRDRTLRPDRPLPAERVSVELAITLAVGTLLTAVLGSLVLGRDAAVLTSVVAVAITAYNVFGRFVPAVGLPILSVIYAGHMLVPNAGLVFVWPVLLVLTHALLIGLASHLLDRRLTRLSARALACAISGWGLCASALLWSASQRSEAGGLWPAWVPAESLWWVAGSIGALLVMCVRRVVRLHRGPRSAEKIRRYGALWPAFYACAWLIGTGRLDAAWPLIGLAVAGLLGMTILREAYALVEEPIEYRS
ncbi:MAG: UbiA family prenyltransferase [Planctomycetota bacterium]